ncbi:MAG: type III secretion inner membrane ring lipoprotein SctJ [Verrucomicrobia bacterium]|nr:type III secretion inner membrane ring lipoprotein SctJ [Verrucomicrobiota bacterium]
MASWRDFGGRASCLPREWDGRPARHPWNGTTGGTPVPLSNPVAMVPRGLKLVSRFALLALLLTLAACSKSPLFSDLNESEADQIVAVLLDKDIQCDKVAGKEGAWVVNIDKKDFPRAVAILDSEGLPRDRFKSMGDIFQKSGLVSTPSEERIRFMYALSQELGQTIEKFDGVVTSRVHIALSVSDSSETPRPASAAVFIKYRPGYDLESVKPDIKNLVSKSVEGLAYDNVTVMLEPSLTVVPTPVNATAKAASTQISWTNPQTILVAALASVPLLLVIVFLLLRRRKSGGQAHGEKLHELANTGR